MWCLTITDKDKAVISSCVPFSLGGLVSNSLVAQHHSVFYIICYIKTEYLFTASGFSNLDRYHIVNATIQVAIGQWCQVSTVRINVYGKGS